MSARQIWRSIDGGKTFCYCGYGKYFRDLWQAIQYKNMSARPGGAAGLAPAARSVGLAGLAETPKIKPGFGGVDCVAVKKTKHRIAEKVQNTKPARPTLCAAGASPAAPPGRALMGNTKPKTKQGGPRNEESRICPNFCPLDRPPGCQVPGLNFPNPARSRKPPV